MPAHPDQIAEAPVRLIKRYTNRKLYDTRESRYVTLQQIASFVRDGEDVRIVDNRTKRDLTKVTLAQIIYEEEKSGVAAERSVHTLVGFIQGRADKLMHSLRGGPVAKLVARKESEQEEASTVEAPAPQTPQEGNPERKSLFSPKEAIDELQRLADDRVRALLQSASAHVNQLQREIGRLQKRIDELEAKLGQNSTDEE